MKQLWEQTPGHCEETPTIMICMPEIKKSDMTVLIFPGGAYKKRSDNEGIEYAKFLAENGYISCVVNYRVAPHKFPLPLLDARRAVRTVRYYANKFGIDKNKIVVMGSSAGGHLSALLSTYFEVIGFENLDVIDEEDFIPNFQVLCYPLIDLVKRETAHIDSCRNLLGNDYAEKCEALSPNLIATVKTPPAFIWHTFTDDAVSVKNSLEYAEKLKNVNVKCELHIFSDGGHALALAKNNKNPDKHIAQWTDLLLNWLNYFDN